MSPACAGSPRGPRYDAVMTLPPDFSRELATKYEALAARTKEARLSLIYACVHQFIAKAEADGKATKTLSEHLATATEALRQNEDARFWIRSDKRSNDELLIEAEPKLVKWILFPPSPAQLETYSEPNQSAQE